MASFTNATRNATTVTNVDKTIKTDTWDEATYTWDDSVPKTWDNQIATFANDTKHSTLVNNQTKN